MGNFGLDVSKIEEHKLVLMEEELDVAEMVESCCCLTKPRAKNRNINLENRVPNGLPTLFAEERAIKKKSSSICCRMPSNPHQRMAR